jgi:outer membrane protein assembly factor BamB
MRNYRWLLVLSVLLLSACSSLEHQSDLPEKSPLPVLETNLSVVKKWSVSTGRGTGSKDIKLSLAQTANSLITADYTGTLVAIKVDTGALQWNLNLAEPVSSGPTIAEQKIVVGTNNGKVIAVALNDHKVAWTSVTSSEVLSTPKIADDLVFVHTMDGALSALTLLDGRQLWRFTHNLPPLVLRRCATPVVNNQQVIAGFSTGKLIAINKQDGTVEWAQDIARPKGKTDLQRMVDISADPIIKNSVVYAASYQGNLAALHADNGHLVWDRDIPSLSGFVLDQKLLYVAATNGDVVAVDQKSGATFWLQSGLQGRLLSTPAMNDNYIVVGDDDGFVHWLDKKTGKLVGRFQLDKHGVEATPIIHNNIVYILGRSGKLVALEVN